MIQTPAAEFAGLTMSPAEAKVWERNAAAHRRTMTNRANAARELMLARGLMPATADRYAMFVTSRTDSVHSTSSLDAFDRAEENLARWSCYPTIADTMAEAQALPGVPEVLSFEALGLFDAAEVAVAPRQRTSAPAPLAGQTALF